MCDLLLSTFAEHALTHPHLAPFAPLLQVSTLTQILAVIFTLFDQLQVRVGFVGGLWHRPALTMVVGCAGVRFVFGLCRLPPLLCLVGAQMVQTSLESVYPWDQSVMEMLRRFNIGPLLFPDPTPTVFGLAFAATVGMVWLSFIDAIYVGYAFHTNRVGSVWPLHILRAAVSVIITAGMLRSGGGGVWFVCRLFHCTTDTPRFIQASVPS